MSVRGAQRLKIQDLLPGVILSSENEIEHLDEGQVKSKRWTGGRRRDTTCHKVA